VALPSDHPDVRARLRPCVLQWRWLARLNYSVLLAIAGGAKEREGGLPTAVSNLCRLSPAVSRLTRWQSLRHAVRWDRQ
jgi:hypothetical protein